MSEKWRVIPKRIGRSRKVQVRQYEPEEIFIEFELDVKDPSTRKEAIEEATELAIAYLDEEEKKLRSLHGDKPVSDVQKTQIKKEFKIQILEAGKKLGNFQIKKSQDPQFENFVHLWLNIEKQDIYVGYLRKDTGDFTFKDKNKPLLDKYGVKDEVHFKIEET